MAFSSVSTGGSGTTKSYFAWTDWRAVTEFSIPENAAYVSPDVGFQPCRTESVTVWASGGAQRIIMVNSLSGSAAVYSSQFNPAGSADETSLRYETNRNLTKALVAGDDYYYGQHCDDGTVGVGFYRNSSGTTYLETNTWANNSTYGGTLRGTIFYNTIPGAPTLNSVVDSLTFGAVDMSWSPGTTGGSAINGYRIEWSTVSDFATLAGSIADTGSTATTLTVTGLNSGTLYYFRVAALNEVSDAHSGQPASIRSNVISSTPTSYGKRYNGSTFAIINTAKRYNASTSSWVTLTTAKRYDASTSSWVNVT
jgi:hypothetical protein